MLAPAGRTVRCSSCTHQWHAAPPAASFAAAVEAEVAAATNETLADVAAAPVATEAAAAPKKVKTPLNIPVRPFQIAAPVLGVVWLVLAYMTYLPHFSRHASPGLEFNEVRMEPKIEGEKTSFVVSGGIVNHESDERQIPTVRVTLRTANDDVIWQREYPVNKPLKGGAVYPFKIANVDTSRGADVAAVELDLGNSTQLRAR